MMQRLLAPLFLILICTGLLAAQAPRDIKTRLTDLRQIEIKPGITRIPNADGAGRDAQVFSAWRDNGNAWGANVYIVTMPPRSSARANNEWWIVGIERDSPDAPSFEITDSPHTGEDSIRSVRFAHGTLDGKSLTLLITAERKWQKAVTDPAPAEIRIYVLKSKEGQGVGTPDVFELAIRFTTTTTYSDANAALITELGLDQR